MIKLKNILLEKTELAPRLVKLISKMTDRNQHTKARQELAYHLSNNKLSKFYAAMEQLNDVFGGYGPELSKLNQKMEKELYTAIKKSYLNSAEVIGLL